MPLSFAVHPGLILKEELEARDLSGTALALKLRVPPQRINDVIGGRRALTAETALRLARFFGNDAAFWMNLQTAYDLAQVEATEGRRIAAEVQAA
ncbi:MAG: HigA family addiction module antidote protein [Rhodospirillaceae bacterium]|nr:HigA family addiction module antidote protein [Rhodospirillaceae bacterium]